MVWMVRVVFVIFGCRDAEPFGGERERFGPVGDGSGLTERKFKSECREIGVWIEMPLSLFPHSHRLSLLLLLVAKFLSSSWIKAEK